MANNPYGVSDDTTASNLTGHVTGTNVVSSFGRNVSVNAYAWFYVVGALALLWLFGGAFRSVLS